MIKKYFHISVSYRLFWLFPFIRIFGFPVSTFNFIDSLLLTSGTLKHIWHLKEWQERLQGQSAAILFEEKIVTEMIQNGTMVKEIE